MRSYLFGAAGMLAIVTVFGHCGGAVDILTGGDASVDGNGSSGGKDGGSSSSGSSGGGSSTSSGSSGGSSGSGSGGSSGSSSGSGSGSGSGSSSGGGSGSSSGGGNCPTCMPGNICCNGVSCDVDSFNDPNNCGSCYHHCQDPTPFCLGGKCTQTPCDGQPCAANMTCCGSKCCQPGDICCEFVGPQDYPGCYTPTAQQPSCPPGCPACVSDRNLKHDVEPVDTESVLERVSRMPITTWSYKSDDPSVRHMGMMAQDFYGEFGLGSTDKAFNPIDAHGVEMAAIQALSRRMQDQAERLERLEKENEQLRARCR